MSLNFVLKGTQFTQGIAGWAFAPDLDGSNPNALQIPTIGNAELSRTVASVSLASDFSLSALPISGDLAVTLAAFSLSSGGALALVGTLSKSLGSVSLSGAATLTIGATLSSAVGSVALSASATGAPPLAADLSATLGAVSLSGAASLAIAASATATAASVSVSSSGLLAVSASSSNALSPVALSSAAALALSAASASALGAFSLSSGATLRIGGLLDPDDLVPGDLAAELGPIVLASAASLKLAATLSASMGAISLSADVNTGAPITANLSASLDPLRLSSSASGLQLPDTTTSAQVATGGQPPRRARRARAPSTDFLQSYSYLAPEVQQVVAKRTAELMAVLGSVRLDARATLLLSPKEHRARAALLH